MSDATDVVAGVKRLEEARKDSIAALKEKEVAASDNMKWSELAGLIEGIEAGKEYKLTITVNNYYCTWTIKITQGNNVQQFNNSTTFTETVEAYLKEGECSIELASNSLTTKILSSNVEGVKVGDISANWKAQAQISPNDDNRFTLKVSMEQDMSGGGD